MDDLDGDIKVSMSDNTMLDQLDQQRTTVDAIGDSLGLPNAAKVGGNMSEGLETPGLMEAVDDIKTSDAISANHADNHVVENVPNFSENTSHILSITENGSSVPIDGGKLSSCSDIVRMETSVDGNMEVLGSSDSSDLVKTNNDLNKEIQISVNNANVYSSHIQSTILKTADCPSCEMSENNIDCDSKTLDASSSVVGGNILNMNAMMETKTLADIDNAYRLRDPFSVSSSESESESDESSSSDSSSDLSVVITSEGGHSDEETAKTRCDKRPPSATQGLDISLRTKGEMTIEDLPPIQDLDIEIDSSVEMVEIGIVAHIVETLAVIQANPDTPALNMDSILFNDKREPLGQIFETFGRVTSPMYTMRFNSDAHLKEKCIEPGMIVFCAPKMTEYTHFIFVDQLKRMKGSDASWENNNEPPKRFLDFSDDEGERRATRGKNRGGDKDDTSGRKNKRTNRQMDSWPPENDPGAPQAPSWQPGLKDIRNPWTGPYMRSRPPFQPRQLGAFRPPPPRSPAPRIPFGRLPPPNMWPHRPISPGWMARLPPGPACQPPMPPPPPNIRQPPPGAFSGQNLFSRPRGVSYNPMMLAAPPPPLQQNGQLNTAQQTNMSVSPPGAAILPSTYTVVPAYQNQAVSNSMVRSNTPPVATQVSGAAIPPPATSPQLGVFPVSYQQLGWTSQAPMQSVQNGPPQTAPTPQIFQRPPPPPGTTAVTQVQAFVTQTPTQPATSWVRGQSVINTAQYQALQYIAPPVQPGLFQQYAGQYYQWPQ